MGFPGAQRAGSNVIDVDTAVLDDLSFSATQEELEKTWSGVLQGFGDATVGEAGGAAGSVPNGRNAAGNARGGGGGAQQRGATPAEKRNAAGGAEVQDYLTQTVNIQQTQFTQGGTGWQVLTGTAGGEAGAGAMSVQTASLASNPWAVNGAYQGVSPQHRDMRPPQHVGSDGSAAGATPQPLDPMDYTLGGTNTWNERENRVIDSHHARQMQDEAAKKREKEEEMKRLKQEMFEREMKAELEYQRTQGLR